MNRSMQLPPAAERRSAGELAAFRQEAWDRQRVWVAERSSFFRRLWDGAAPPADLRDLPDLPLCSKADLRASQAAFPPFGDYLAAEPSDGNRLHRTSGTTGQAMTLLLSARDAAVTEIVGARCQSAAGLGPGHRVAHCLNYRMWMGGLTDHMTLERTGATVIPFGVGDTALLIRTVRELGVTALSCTPSYPAVLERVLAERFEGLKPADLNLKLGLFGGEPGLDDPALRERIRAVWGMEPRNANYGVTDVFCNFAGQCAEDTRLHFMAYDVLHPELIEPGNGTPIPIAAGATGELVLTHLLRDCQPLVRFRTGDIVAVDETDPCRCGRTGMRFRVIGRSDDMVIVRGLNLFPTQVAATVTRFAELTGDYRIVLDTSPPYDTLPLQVEAVRPVADPDALAAAVAAAVKEDLGATARVTVLAPGTLPLTEGKTARVIRKTPA